MTRVTRLARGAAIALAFALIAAAPAAAAEPSRGRFDLTGTYVFSAQESGCGFAISRTYLPGARATITEFSDGTEVVEQHSMATLTNVATGATFLRKNSYRDAAWFDAASGVIHGFQSGQMTWSFYPGDMGPYGIVQAPGLGLHFDGTIRYAYDLTAGFITEFSYAGASTDVCAALS